MADGCFCLAQIWDSAWKEGKGDVSMTSFDTIDEATLEDLYRNPDFLKSYTLNTIGPVLGGGEVQNDQPAAPRRARRAHSG